MMDIKWGIGPSSNRYQQHQHRLRQLSTSRQTSHHYTKPPTKTKDHSQQTKHKSYTRNPIQNVIPQQFLPLHPPHHIHPSHPSDLRPGLRQRRPLPRPSRLLQRTQRSGNPLPAIQSPRGSPHIRAHRRRIHDRRLELPQLWHLLQFNVSRCHNQYFGY